MRISKNMAFTFPSKIIRHYVAHPCLSLLSLLGLSLALMEIIQIGPMPLLPAMLYGVLAVSFVLLPVINDQTCWAIIVAGSAISISLTQDSPFVVSGMLIALGILAFSGTVSEWLIAMLICSCTYIARSVMVGNFNVFVSVSVTVMFLASLLAGRLVALRQQAFIREEQRLKLQLQLQRLDYMKQKNRLAIQIHDSLTNNLSDISLMARIHIDDNIPDGDDWAIVLEHSQEAFTQVHDIIDILSSEDKDAKSETTFMVELRNLLDERCSHLHALGYEGDATIEGFCIKTTQEEKEEVLSLIKEICNNIQRHSLPHNGSFELIVRLSPSSMEINEMNDITAGSSLAAFEQSGRGLSLHSKRIQELGGELNYRSDDGLWVLYAKIPLSHMETTKT
ncbi:histidine kinase [Bifidobacterium breve]|uniref:histidine kinase n=1 Tax=Bifidobacterium breve TaxID=1685 RepID=UPI00059C648E